GAFAILPCRNRCELRGQPFAMNTSLLRRCLPLLSAALVSLIPIAFAQSLGTGTIEGRVANTRIGESLEHARVTVEGTTLEAFTDSSGQYRIGNVPAGTVKLKV